MLQKFLSAALVCFLAGAFLSLGAPKKSAGKKPAAKKSAKSSAKRTRQAAGKNAAPAGAPKQMSPTPERYMEVQQALATRGYYSGPIDGAWSSECVEALKRFQADQDLEPDGKLGALSLIGLGLGPNRDTVAELPASPSHTVAP